jgi:tetratricopeptide (TPR) repeat protein
VIGRANALKYEKDAFREAMLTAVEHTADPQKRAGILSELAFQVAFRWNHAEDRERIATWIEQALALADPVSPARAWALVARSYCRPEEAEEAAREATVIAERLPDPELRSYAFHARADGELAQGRYDDALAWAERRLGLLPEVGDPDHVADIYWSAIPGYLGRGRFDDARRLAELHDEVTRELTPHHRLHGVAFVLEIEELAGNWERIRELAARAEQAALASTPCVHRPRSLLVCALASACLGDEDEARRLERVADSLGASSGGALDAQRVSLALIRGDLDAVRRLLAEAEKPRRALIRSTKLAPVAARLDALAALGEEERIEAEVPPLLRPETYLEPFALRALGLTRSDKELLERAAAHFEAMGLAWHAVETIRQRDLASARG